MHAVLACMLAAQVWRTTVTDLKGVSQMLCIYELLLISQAEVGQLQGQLQTEVKRLQGQLQQARNEEEEAQEQRHILKLQLTKVGNYFLDMLHHCYLIHRQHAATFHSSATQCFQHTDSVSPDHT